MSPPSWTLKCRTRPRNRQTFYSKGCRLQRSLEAMNSCLLYLPALSMSQEWRGEFCSLAADSLALLLANEAPCPSADYQSLLAHRAYFMHCLQETQPGNLYLQGWQTAISSITGWLRETEPIKWILESTGVFTSVLSKGGGKKSLQCWVYCTFQKRSAHAMQTQCLSQRCQNKHEQQEAQIIQR